MEVFINFKRLFLFSHFHLVNKFPWDGRGDVRTHIISSTRRRIKGREKSQGQAVAKVENRWHLHRNQDSKTWREYVTFHKETWRSWSLKVEERRKERELINCEEIEDLRVSVGLLNAKKKPGICWCNLL